ncbi:SLD3 DNA replication regulator SLD3 [Candida maltosa Xu316]
MDPCEFLRRRYYSTLYSLNNPLSYFPKTALPRFKNMCSENDNVVDLLKGFSLTLVEFDNRHNHKHGLFEHNREVSVVELHERESFKTNHGFSIELNESENENGDMELKGISVEKFSGLCLNLKIREAQLQMLVIFEILSLMEIDELEFLERNKKIQADTEKEKETKAKQSLIRRRNKKSNKKVKSEKQVVQSDEYLMFSLLTNLIDRLSLWDTLSTKTEGSGTYGFMAYVLVPYFNKKLPNLIKHVIENMKGSNMKLISFKRKKEDDHEKPKSKSKYKKVLLEKKPPQLSKSTSLAESDDFKPLTSLKRSESNLSTKYLSKREVDLNIKQASKNPLDVPSSQSFIFASQAKRSKSIASIPTITSTTTSTSQREVMATPRKPKFMKSKSQIEPRHISSQTQVQATPAKPKDNSYHSSSLHTVEATPNTSITSVVSTPMNLFAKPDKKQNSINEKLLSASKEVIIDATPRKLIIQETPPKGFGSPTMLETPIQRIQSSPIQSQKKSKPGDPISMETSPFVNVLKDSESLMSFKPVKLFNDEEYDSDELLNPKKKVVRTTYSKRKK